MRKWRENQTLIVAVRMFRINGSCSQIWAKKIFLSERNFLFKLNFWKQGAIQNAQSGTFLQHAAERAVNFVVQPQTTTKARARTSQRAF